MLIARFVSCTACAGSAASRWARASASEYTSDAGIARFASPKGVFYRLSVRGFGSDAEARNMCMALRRQGGSCFVRNFAGDQPVQYASR